MLPCVFCSCGQYTSTEEGYGPNYSEFHYAEFLFCRFKLSIALSGFSIYYYSSLDITWILLVSYFSKKITKTSRRKN